jgi:rhodanese-related sulfurtransferase
MNQGVLRISFLTLFVFAGLISATTISVAKESTDTTDGSDLSIGKVVGKSNKAKEISIEQENGETVMMSFDDITGGLEYAVKGCNAVVTYEMIEGKPHAIDIQQKLAELPKGVTSIEIPDLQGLMKRKEKIFLIDSRPASRFAESHLPGAISIPSGDMVRLLPKLPPDKNSPLIFYCDGVTCNMSSKSAGQAAKAGYTNVKILFAGIRGWIKAGYPTYATNDEIFSGNIVLIDLRSTEKAEKARIPRSINMPSATFTDSFDLIPMKAPVVLYSDSDAESLAALTLLRENDYKRVSLIEGNFEGWLQIGGALQKGPVETKPRWTRKLEEGEVSRADFEAALKDPNKALILDVRGPEETAKGKFPQAHLVPLNLLCQDKQDPLCHIQEINSQQKIYIHCSTGARAEMAYKELKKRGLNVFFLVAVVTCEKGGCSVQD